MSQTAAESKPRHEQYLAELTSLPTAAGREQRVVDWVRAWVGQHPEVRLQADDFGNLWIAHCEADSESPIVFEAHMDHPAFVVTAVEGQYVHADFRGGVHDDYFKDASVLLYAAAHDAPVRGQVVDYQMGHKRGEDRKVQVRFDQPVDAEPGEVMTWDLPPARVEESHLHAPACDDLAAVAAALAAFEQLLDEGPEVAGRAAVLLTRAEEVGFIGAMAACRSGIIPPTARLIALENSKSFAESPIGDGPILRVGDRTSTFDPDLTYRLGKFAESLTANDAGFAWQRKLMPGGTCEASAYQALGYTATCLCLPLGNYHNMNEDTGRIASERISLADYHALIRWLTAIGRSLDDAKESRSLRQRLDDLFEKRRSILDEE